MWIVTQREAREQPGSYRKKLFLGSSIYSKFGRKKAGFSIKKASTKN